jgi:hypothetical protein
MLNVEATENDKKMFPTISNVVMNKEFVGLGHVL